MKCCEILLILILCYSQNLQVYSQNYQRNSNYQKRTNDNYDNINQYSNEAVFNEAASGNLDNLNEIGNSENSNSGAAFFETIPGEPKRDYPTYKTIPKTGFSCKGRVNWGYYADVETACQVFHVCESENSKISFLCPVGSAFNQKHLVCDWWYNFDCHDEISLTSLYDDYDILRIDTTPTQGNSFEGRGKTLAKRRGNEYDNEEDYDNDDLNLVSSGGNI